MNTTKILSMLFMFSLFFTMHAIAADTPSKAGTSNSEQGQPVSLNAEKLVGQKVESKDGKDVGQVQKVVVNPSNSQPTYAIVLSANKLYPVPMNALTVQPEQNKIALSIDKKKFETAPSFPQDRMPDMTSPKFNSLVDQFYGVKPS
jgi:hypothetical protein